MLAEIIALILGILAGTITGLLPGIHINLVAAFLTSSLAFFLAFSSPITLVVFIVSMSITHTFLDFIPSIFLGAPDEDSSLSVLPGHQYLLQGKAHQALIYTAYGGLIALPIIILFAPIFIFIMPHIFYYLKFVMFFIMLLVSIYMIFTTENKTLAFIIFMLSGFLGISSLNIPVQNSLLPLLSGLFGSSSLITSMIKKQKLKPQKIESLKNIRIEKQDLINTAAASSFAAPLCSFLPALGSSQAAVLSSSILDKTNQKQFLILLGSINTIIMGLSFVTLYAIEKARTGSAAAISTILQSFTASSLIIILATIIISGILAFFLSIFISRIFARNINKINYFLLSIFILIFLSLVVILFSGWLGFLVYIISTFTGLSCILLNVRRTNLMGALMLPTILLYLPFI